MSTQTVLACLAVTMLSSSCTSVAPAWQSLDRRDPGSEELAGVWENPATGHLVYFRPDSTEVFHRLGDFCIRDNGVVPSYSLYRFGETGDELLLHYYDYRDRPELLQAPLVFRRSGALPDACRTEVVDGQTDPATLFELITQTFDRFYAFFDERGVNWEATKRRYAARGQALSSDEQLFEVLAEIFVSPPGRGERRPVLLLTSEVTASAAESFVLMMRAFPHVTHVGGPHARRLVVSAPQALPERIPSNSFLTRRSRHQTGCEQAMTTLP
jgi:hypothetical protein